MMLAEIAPDNPASAPVSPAEAPPSDRPPLPALDSWRVAEWSRRCPQCGADDGCRRTHDGGREVWACRHQLDHWADPPVPHDGAGFTIYRHPERHKHDVFNEVLRTIKTLRPEGLMEVRVLGLRPNHGGKSYTASGYFDDPHKAARAALQYEAKRPDGIYLLLNEPDAALFARSPNKMTDYPKATTSDQDVVRRRWLLLDLDPKRPSGVASNPRQLASAERLSRECRDLLCGAGWPAPVEAMSGNGAYLLFGLDLPNDAETTALATDVLKAINHKVGQTGVPADEPIAQVDLTTFNAARIARLLGTMNRKGHPTPALPHRRSRLLAVPDRVEPVPVELLRAAIRDWSPPTPSRGTPRVTPVRSEKAPAVAVTPPTAAATAAAPAPAAASDFRHRLKVDAWLTDRGFGFAVKPAADCHGRAVYLLDRCPFDASHGGSKEVAVYQAGDGKMAARCMHNSCTGRGWKEFKAAIGLPDPAHYDPRPVPTASAAPAPPGHEHTTDLGNARRLVTLFGADLRHCHPWGKDMVWDGRRWAADDTARVERLAKDTVRSIYAELAPLTDPYARQRLAKHAAASESARSIGAMIRLARSEPTIPVLPADLDRDPWALNVLNGTLDLQTGTLRPHRRDDLLTRLAPVAYDPAALCPIWEAFLDNSMGGNARLVAYLRRVIGYALTGSVAEQVMWVLFGEGANGKSTFLNAVMGVLGDLYAMQAVPELVMARQSEAHPTERADLFGRRLVACVETEQGRRLAESLVKQLTGGERVRARRMREDFWEFDPTHKLFLVTNHKPTIRGADKGIWRRMKLVPFTVTIPDAKKDPALPEKLKAEWPGILAWAVRGCLEWQRSGLDHPPEVENATAAYREEMDTVGAFLSECCAAGPDEFRVRKTSLYAAYSAWSAKSGDAAIGRNDFNRRLGELNFQSKRSAGNGAEQWHGLALLPGPRGESPAGEAGRMAQAAFQELSGGQSLGEVRDPIKAATRMTWAEIDQVLEA